MSKDIKKVKLILLTALIMIAGLVIFKYIPMGLYGKNILFDASSHMVWTSFGLYFLWFFVDQNKSWRTPYFIFSAAILTIMGIQRIVAGKHNEVGIFLGLGISFFAIVIPRWKEFFRKIDF